MSSKIANETFIYLNARSVLCNLAHIEIMSKKIKPLIIFCSEARVTDEISDEIKIDGYNEIVCTSSSRLQVVSPFMYRTI